MALPKRSRKYLMRQGELLLEYDRSKTIARFGPALLERIKEDRSTHPLKYDATNRALTDLLTQHLGPDHEDSDLPPEFDDEYAALADRYILETVMVFIERADPTATNEYIPWLITRYIKGGISAFEDISSTAADLLAAFDETKRAGYFRRQTDPAITALADIGRFQTVDQLFQFVQTLSAADRTSNNRAERMKEDELFANGSAKLIHNSDRFKIISLETEEAAMFFGRNTQWCTAAKKGNMFTQYHATGKLIMILDKPTNRRWQFHFGEGQFMDERDKPIEWGTRDFPKQIWYEIDWRPYMSGMTVQGCSEMLIAVPMDYMPYVLEKADLTSIVMAYLRLPTKEKRPIIREFIKEQIRHMSPTETVKGDGWEFDVWDENFAAEHALAYTISTGKNINALDTPYAKIMRSLDIYSVMKATHRSTCFMAVRTNTDDFFIDVHTNGIIQVTPELGEYVEYRRDIVVAFAESPPTRLGTKELWQAISKWVR